MAERGRPDLFSILQRVAELVVRLVTQRLELAETHVRDGASRVGRASTLGLAGGLLTLVGVLLVADAAVEAIAPWVASRAVRLLTVAAPFLLAGVTATASARAALKGQVGGAAAEMPQKRYVQKKLTDPTPASPNMPSSS